MEYKSRITNIGVSKIAEAIIKGETINLVSIAAGDGGGEPYEPTGSETKLKNEVWRGKITGVEEDCTNGNAYNLITTIPQSAEGFFIRELAAYDSEGDCIAIANTPTIEKKGASTGVGIELTVNMQLIFENADQVNVVIAPLATKEITNRIGNTIDTGGSTTSGTVMGKLNKVLENEEGSKTNTEALKNDIASVKENVSSVKSDVAGVKADVSNVKTSVTAVSNKIGTATDTGGSSTAGTVMGKLNSISKNAKKAYVWDGGKTKVSLGHISSYDNTNNGKVLILSDCFVPEYDGIIQIGLTGTISNAPSSVGIHGLGWSSIDANGDKNARNTVNLPYMIYAKGTVISYGVSSFPSHRGTEMLWSTPTTNGEINLTAFLKVSKGAQLNIFSFPYTENVTISDVFVKYDIKEV